MLGEWLGESMTQTSGDRAIRGDVLRLGVLGAYGRMGSQICQAVAGEDGIELAATIGRTDKLTDLTSAGADVAVDFTHPDAVMNHVQWCVEHGIHCVVGTDVLPETKFDTIRGWLTDQPTVGVLIAPIFSIGAVVGLRLAESAARHFESAEIIELHHATKADAPASPGVHLARGIAKVRRDAGFGAMPDATNVTLPGARGVDIDGVRVHSVRVTGLVGHLEVILGAAGETLTIRHDQLDRKCFLPGLFMAVRAIANRPGLTVGLGSLLDD
jgi:4-hydroxy-tetrahydrodipicolinate reductase